MSDTLTEREIEEQLELRRQRFEQVVQDIRRCLQLDLEAFFVRETKKAFLSQPAVAQGMTPESILALRKEAVALGKSEAAQVFAALGDIALWRTGADGERDNDKTELSEVKAVWNHVNAGEAALATFLHRHGFAETVRPVYKTPSFFVAGLYMPGLTEHFWKIIEEIRDLHAQKGALTTRVTREKLQALWDGAVDD